MELITLEKISLKNNPNITEDMIQSFIFDNPSVLGLGELTPIRREKIQPSGGRLDLLLERNDDSDKTRYEVEIQLGPVDASHIIRTIEYWDTERKRYPQYNHCAVIVAEGISGRFMNVISLFNGSIPLIALDLSAYKKDEDIILTFTKVLDKITLGTEEEEQYEVADRKFWENKSTSLMLSKMDEIFKYLKEFISNCELKYTKSYITISTTNSTNNFIWFKPKKKFLNLHTKGHENISLIEKLEDAGIDVSYSEKWNEYRVKIESTEDYLNNKDIVDALIKASMEYYNISN